MLISVCCHQGALARHCVTICGRQRDATLVPTCLALVKALPLAFNLNHSRQGLIHSENILYDLKMVSVSAKTFAYVSVRFQGSCFLSGFLQQLSSCN